MGMARIHCVDGDFTAVCEDSHGSILSRKGKRVEVEAILNVRLRISVAFSVAMLLMRCLGDLMPYE